MGSPAQKGSLPGTPPMRRSVAAKRNCRSGSGHSGVRMQFLFSEKGQSAYTDFIVSFTAATSWLSVNGFGRKANC